MVPGKYKLGKQYKGDTFSGVRFTIKDKETDTGIDLTDATIKIQFRRNSAKGAIIKELTELDGVTIEDAANGIFTIDPFITDWTPADYYYDIQITFLSGVIKTYIMGTICIIQDITYV